MKDFFLHLLLCFMEEHTIIITCERKYVTVLDPKHVKILDIAEKVKIKTNNFIHWH